MNCPFCNILASHPDQIIRETNTCFVVLSNPRLVPGHLLVIPKHHVEKFSELTKEEREDLLNEAVYLEEKILKNFASGCDLSQHYRPFIKQDRLKVNHLHIHLRPRELEDELYQKVQIHEKEVFADLEEGEIERYRKILL